jgi:integrase
MAIISLHSGLRAGEIFSLTWGDIDLQRGIMTLRDTKSGRTRPAFMTEDVKRILADKDRGGNDDLIFTDPMGNKIKAMSRSFERIVTDLGFNEGVTDPRQKVVFHTLRHTYASWLVESGVDLYKVQKLMGHSTISLTERYAHLSNTSLQEAVKALEKNLSTHKSPIPT